MIAEALRRFVLNSIPSVPHLEAVLLFRAEPEQAKTAGDLARALYIAEPAAAAILAYLGDIGCLQDANGPRGAYVYAPRDAAMRDLLDQLAAAYRTEMIEVTHLIHDTTQRHAHRFADAFKFRKGR